MLFNKIKYFASLIISIYLFHRISKEIYFNIDRFVILKDKFFVLLFFFFLFLPIFYFLTLKLIILVNHIKKIKFYESFKATIIAFNYNLFLPAKSGDFLRYKYLDLKISFTNFFNINVIEKLISFLILFLLVIFSFFFTKFEIPFVINLSFIYLLSIFLGCLLVLIIILYKLCNIENFKIKKIISLSLFDLTIWFLQFFQIAVIIEILKIDINFYEIIFIFGSAVIAGLIPISLGGFV